MTEAKAELLRRLQSGEALDSGALLQQMISARPELAPLMAAFQNAPSDGRRERVVERIAELKAEVEDLRRVVELFADAVGACVCFGRNPECEECGGAGVPGSAPPAPELFRSLVLPAFRRLRESTPQTKEK